MKENDIKDIVEGIKSLEKLSGGNLSHWRYVLENANSIWERCPFKVGDLVQLTRTPEITREKSWGWMGAKHFLVKGALARIGERDFYRGLFSFGLLFEDETWIDRDGNKKPVDGKALYCFSENWISLVEKAPVPPVIDQLTCEAL